jgi:transmembrane sensor
MGSDTFDTRSVIARQAIEWFVRNRDGISTAERAAFRGWLMCSPQHVEEYLKTAAMSRNLQEAIDGYRVPPEALAEQSSSTASSVISSTGVEGGSVVWLRDRRMVVDPPGGAEPSPAPAGLWKRLTRPAAAVAAVLAVAALALLAASILAGVAYYERDGERFGLPKEFVTGHAEQRSWLLPDGTSLNLNSDSDVVVHYNGHERLVEMRRGQALFRVAHEAARRFRVSAGETGVIAVGTQFDVWRKPTSTLVTVVEGNVAVFTGEAPPSTAAATLPSQAVAVGAGQQLQVEDHSKPSSPLGANVQLTVAWVQHQIAFDQRPLGDVAAEFNRYGSVPIVVDSERLRALEISGIFSEYDTESFVAFISRLDHVSIERSPHAIRVVDQLKSR